MLRLVLVGLRETHVLLGGGGAASGGGGGGRLGGGRVAVMMVARETAAIYVALNKRRPPRFLCLRLRTGSSIFSGFGDLSSLVYA